MSILRSFASYYCQKLHLRTCLGACNHNLSASRFQELATFEQRRFLAINPNGGFKNSTETDSNATDKRPTAQPHQQKQDRTPFLTWARLAIGSILAILAPFLHTKWAAFLRIRSEVEMAKDVAETVAEVVEEVATVAEKVSSEVAEQLPEDGKLKQAAVLVEHASKEVAEEAHLAKDIIHKVDEIEDDVKTMLGPIIEHDKHSDGNKQSNSNP